MGAAGRAAPGTCSARWGGGGRPPKARRTNHTAPLATIIPKALRQSPLLAHTTAAAGTAPTSLVQREASLGKGTAHPSSLLPVSGTPPSLSLCVPATFIPREPPAFGAAASRVQRVGAALRPSLQYSPSPFPASFRPLAS